MSVISVSPVALTAEQLRTHQRERQFALLFTGALTIVGLFVNGYHPYAEDGGLYLAGIKRLLDPTLYPHQTAFVIEHLRFSLFAPMVASLVRSSGLSTDWVLFLIYLATYWATLLASWMLVARCYSSRAARAGGVALIAVWLTLPVAGTSLMLMDPYVTARSISTPCVLFALVATLDMLNGDPLKNSPSSGWRQPLIAAVLILLASLMHPLMAGYGAAAALALVGSAAKSRRARWLASTALCGTALLLASSLRATIPPDGPPYREIALTRYYWFLDRWHWYEIVGIIAPLVILFIARRFQVTSDRAVGQLMLIRAALTLGIAAILVAVLFARSDSATFQVARLQPLRAFQIVYVVMILLLGAELAQRALGKNVLRWVSVFGLLAAIMIMAERHTFPASPHIEMPASGSRGNSENSWVQAFLWIRTHTPKDALLALDTDYIQKPGEDAQVFRAIAERSALPDYSKDGGEAAITPSLTRSWIEGQHAQAGLSQLSDEQRISRLRPFGVSWIVLERNASTSLACGYTNQTVKVCRLPDLPAADFALSSRSQALPLHPTP